MFRVDEKLSNSNGVTEFQSTPMEIDLPNLNFGTIPELTKLEHLLSPELTPVIDSSLTNDKSMGHEYFQSPLIKPFQSRFYPEESEDQPIQNQSHPKPTEVESDHFSTQSRETNELDIDTFFSETYFSGHSNHSHLSNEDEDEDEEMLDLKGTNEDNLHMSHTQDPNEGNEELSDSEENDLIKNHHEKLKELKTEILDGAFDKLSTIFEESKAERIHELLTLFIQEFSINYQSHPDYEMIMYQLIAELTLYQHVLPKPLPQALRDELFNLYPYLDLYILKYPYADCDGIDYDYFRLLQRTGLRKEAYNVIKVLLGVMASQTNLNFIPIQCLLKNEVFPECLALGLMEGLVHQIRQDNRALVATLLDLILNNSWIFNKDQCDSLLVEILNQLEKFEESKDASEGKSFWNEQVSSIIEYKNRLASISRSQGIFIFHTNQLLKNYQADLYKQLLNSAVGSVEEARICHLLDDIKMLNEAGHCFSLVMIFIEKLKQGKAIEYLNEMKKILGINALNDQTFQEIKPFLDKLNQYQNNHYYQNVVKEKGAIEDSIDEEKLTKLFYNLPDNTAYFFQNIAETENQAVHAICVYKLSEQLFFYNPNFNDGVPKAVELSELFEHFIQALYFDFNSDIPEFLGFIPVYFWKEDLKSVKSDLMNSSLSSSSSNSSQSSSNPLMSETKHDMPPVPITSSLQLQSSQSDLARSNHIMSRAQRFSAKGSKDLQGPSLFGKKRKEAQLNPNLELSNKRMRN